MEEVSIFFPEGSTFELYNNTAMSIGGGLHAISSLIKAYSNYNIDSNSFYQYTGTRLNFTNNVAKFGGGLSLEANAKLNILKYDGMDNSSDSNTVLFTGNSADYGGVVYVNDTISGTCVNEQKTECFFQVLVLNNIISPITLRKTMYFF